MRQTRSQTIAVSSNARWRLRSDRPLAISKSKSRRQAPRVRRRLPSATAITQDATEDPIPRSPPHGLDQAADLPILDQPAAADSAAGQTPDLAREVSAGPTGEGGNLFLEHDLAEAASVGLVMEETAASGPGAPAELTNEDGEPATEGTFDSVEPAPDSVMEEAGEPVEANPIDGSRDGYPSGLVVPGTSHNPIEIEDSNEVDFNHNHARAIWSEYNLLDLFEDNNNASEQFIGPQVHDRHDRILPCRKARDQGRLQQQRDEHVGSTIRVLQAMIEQVQSRDACERVETVEVPADLLCSEIDAASVTIVMAELLCLRALDYRKHLLRSRRGDS